LFEDEHGDEWFSHRKVAWNVPPRSVEQRLAMQTTVTQETTEKEPNPWKTFRLT